MPKKGYHSITLPDPVFSKVKAHAEKNHRTIPEDIEHLLANNRKEA